MEVEPWEALDLDDSDLPSLLRPCKRRRSASTTTTTTTNATTAAANPRSQSTSTGSPEHHRPEQLQRQPPPSTSRDRTIRGPAGAVQTAMLRKNLDRENQNLRNYQRDSGEDVNGNYNRDGVITTQEYIRLAMEDTADFDNDFTCQPWLSALQFLGGVKSTPISSVKKYMNGSKVVRVVAVIKSCTPNGRGGLIVSLKDPTGTVGASIHHKVLSTSESGKNITIGSVLILKEVAIFAPARSARYLNITLKNLVKVFCQNTASGSNLNESACLIQYADPGVGIGGKSQTMETMSTIQNVAMEETDKSQHLKKTEDLQNCSVIQRQNLFVRNVRSTDGASTNGNGSRKGLINLCEDVGNALPDDINRTRVAGNSQEFMKGGNLEENLNGANKKESVMKSSGQEIQVTNEVQMQSPPRKSKASMPQWTDEQLDELFAGDEDDGFLF